jgi:hypothetical protein
VCVRARGAVWAQHADSTSIKPLSTMSIVFVMLFVSFFELGPGEVPTLRLTQVPRCVLCISSATPLPFPSSRHLAYLCMSTFAWRTCARPCVCFPRMCVWQARFRGVSVGVMRPSPLGLSVLAHSCCFSFFSVPFASLLCTLAVFPLCMLDRWGSQAVKFFPRLPVQQPCVRTLGDRGTGDGCGCGCWRQGGGDGNRVLLYFHLVSVQGSVCCACVVRGGGIGKWDGTIPNMCTSLYHQDWCVRIWAPDRWEVIVLDVCVCVCVLAAFCAAHNWFANTLIALFFPSVNNALGHSSFVPFAGASSPPACSLGRCGSLSTNDYVLFPKGW